MKRLYVKTMYNPFSGPFEAVLIAPCGMNCGLCKAFLRTRNPCPGCRGNDQNKPKTRVRCKIKKCETRLRSGADFCSSSCMHFPCEALSRLDKRYRQNYGMSMIENVKRIEIGGLQNFLTHEKSKWTCLGCGELLCVHEPLCRVCNRKWR